MTFRPLATRLALLLVGLGWLALAHPQAQTAPVISWTHPGTNVTHFQIVIGTTGTWVVDAGMPTPSGTTYEYALPALPAGQWQVKVRACYGADCQDSATMTVVKMVPAGSTALNYYWVDDDGTVTTWANCKSDTPLSGAAACTRNTANAYAVAGETVWFRGGTYPAIKGSGLDYEGIDPHASGSSGSRIVFAAHPNETPILASTAAFTYGFFLNGDDYVVIRGVTFRGFNAWAYIIHGSDHNEIAYNTFESEDGHEVGFGILLDGDLSCATHDCWVTHNWIHHNTFNRRVASDPCSEGVDHVRVSQNHYANNPVQGDNYNSFENNVFASVGHTAIDNFGTYTVIRQNVSHNEPWLTGCTNWQDFTSSSSVAIGTGSKSFTIETGQTISVGAPIAAVYDGDYANAMNGLVASYNSETGALVVTVTKTAGSGTYSAWTLAYNANIPYYTIASYNGKFGHRNFQLSDDYSRTSSYVLLEGNRLGHASNNPGNNGPMNLDAAAPSNIIRYNDVYNGMSSGIYFKYATSAWLPCDGVRDANGDCGGVNNKVFHNTVYHNGYGYEWDVYSAKNATSSRLGIAQWNAAGTGTTGNVIKNNIVYDNHDGDICRLGLYAAGCSAESWDTVTSNWLTTDGDPVFAAPTLTDPTSTTLPNLTLQASSSAINGATYLTQASGASGGDETPSTTLVVDDNDAWYFQDGTWGSDLARTAGVIHADWISVGTVSNIAQISSINYVTHTITLAAPLTWSDNANVWLYKKSDGVLTLVGAAPDYGAHEYGAGTAAAPTGVVVR